MGEKALQILKNQKRNNKNIKKEKTGSKRADLLDLNI